jgi:hypothetical protein
LPWQPRDDDQEARFRLTIPWRVVPLPERSVGAKQRAGTLLLQEFQPKPNVWAVFGNGFAVQIRLVHGLGWHASAAPRQRLSCRVPACGMQLTNHKRTGKQTTGQCSLPILLAFSLQSAVAFGVLLEHGRYAGANGLRNVLHPSEQL